MPSPSEPGSPARSRSRRDAAATRAWRTAAGVLVLLGLAVPLASCAYYNTYYLARRYYDRATDGQPYILDASRPGTQPQHFTKSIEFSKKLLASYPKSKWIDDAYLMWAKALIGRDDPLQTINMLQDFATRFPQSNVKAESRFFLGLAYRRARKYPEAVDVLGDFVQSQPKSPLAPYGWLELSQALNAQERYADAAKAAGEILERYPGSGIADRALLARAEARLKGRDFDGARTDFHTIGTRVLDENQRFDYLLREADCLEAAHRFDDELALLRDAIGGLAPPPALAPGQVPPPPTPAGDRYGRLTLRIGTAELLAGRLDQALEQYAHALSDYPKSAIAAEAQYQIGYAYETLGDDFDRARQEYAKVKEQVAASGFNTLATARSSNLERIAQYRTGSGADSLEKRAEAGFLTAEQYLFELDKPERAIEEYGRVVTEYPGTPAAGRALLAQGWVWSRKLSQPGRADSLFWRVVRDYPATEAQLAARDYLEAEGVAVDPSLIVAPKPPPPPDTTVTRADTTALTPPPATTPRLGPAVDSLGRGRMRPGIPGEPAVLDSLLRRGRPFAPPDSLGGRRPIPADTTRRDSVRVIEK